MHFATSGQKICHVFSYYINTHTYIYIYNAHNHAQVREHRLVGGKHPWYVFRGHPIPDRSEEGDSLVKWDDMPTPPLLQKAFERMIPSNGRGKDGEESREIYVNSQWALGGEGTGAPVSVTLTHMATFSSSKTH